MLTLTVSNKNYESPDHAARDLKRGLVALRKRVNRLDGAPKISFLAVFEKHKSGWPHLHLLIRAPFLPVRWLRACWEEITGSFMVDVRAIKTIGQAALYVAKYVGKDLASFEHCKRWWRSHDYNEPQELTPDEIKARRGWTRYEGNVDQFAYWLRLWGMKFEQKADGRITWVDDPDRPLHQRSAINAARTVGLTARPAKDACETSEWA